MNEQSIYNILTLERIKEYHLEEFIKRNPNLNPIKIKQITNQEYLISEPEYYTRKSLKQIKEDDDVNYGLLLTNQKEIDDLKGHLLVLGLTSRGYVLINEPLNMKKPELKNNVLKFLFVNSLPTFLPYDIYEISEVESNNFKIKPLVFYTGKIHDFDIDNDYHKCLVYDVTKVKLDAKYDPFIISLIKKDNNTYEDIDKEVIKVYKIKE